MPSSTIRRRDSQRRAQQARITDDLRTANRYEDGENAITTDMKSIKGPSMAAKANRNVKAANAKAWRAAVKENIKRDELRTANRHISDEAQVELQRVERKPNNPQYQPNKWIETRDYATAQKKASAAVRKTAKRANVKKSK